MLAITAHDAEEFLKLFVGPLAGAFFGAVTAQGLARRNAEDQRKREEYRAINTGIVAASSIVNVYASLKRQHVKPMKEAFEAVHARLEAHHAEAHGQPFKLDPDLKSLRPIRSLENIVERTVAERVGVPAAVLAIYAMMIQAQANVAGGLEERNALIKELHGMTADQRERVAEIYLGVIDDHGDVDTRFADCIDIVSVSTDDVLAFSFVLTKLLVRFAGELKAKGKKDWPAPPKPNFQQMVDTGLIPDLATHEQSLKNLGVDLAELP